MHVYWDANPLASNQVTGIVVYAANLFAALGEYPDLEITGLIKPKRLKRRKYIAQHAAIRTQIYVPPFSDLFLDRHAVYHGLDFKVPTTRRIPRVVTIHDLGVFEKGFSDERFRAEGMRYNEWLLKKVQPERIIVPTQAVADHLEALFPGSSARVRAIHHGHEQVFHTTADAALSQRLRNEMPFILVPGSVEKRKNAETIIAAYEKSRASNEMRLIFAGVRGFGYEDIKRRKEDSPAGGKILFEHQLTSAQLMSLYQAAEFTLYPSLFEGFGLPIVEAFALGSPLITSNIGAMREVAGDAALTCDPRSAEGIASAIDTMAYDEAVRAAYQSKGLARAKAFSWRNSAAATRDVYLELKQ